MHAFVHILDDEGALLFTDDHEPVPPPSAWLPGRTYSYSRVALTPEFPFVGVATVVVGLYDETGMRVTLTGDDFGQRRYRVTKLRLLPRDRDLPVRCDGFYESEAAVIAPLVVARFMKSAVTCRFPNPGEDVAIFLRGDIEPDGFSAPPRVTLVGTSRRKAVIWYEADLPLVADARVLRVRVPAGRLGRQPEAAFAIRVSDSYRPRLLGGDDPRELSLRVLGMSVVRAARLHPALMAELASGAP